MFELTSSLRTNRQKMYVAPEGHTVNDVNKVSCGLFRYICKPPDFAKHNVLLVVSFHFSTLYETVRN